LNYQNILAELLHIGLVAEKGRCYGRRWKCGYKKALRNHVKALHLLQVSLQSDNLQKKKDAISDFIIICNNNPDFGRFYTHAFGKIKETKIQETDLIHCMKVDTLFDELFFDLLAELNRFIPSHKKIYYLLCALHNLPRVYFNRSKQGLSGENGGSITEDEALQYAFSTMNKY